MLTIRLARVGRENLQKFRLVVQEKTKSPKSGKVVAIVGSYDPLDPENKFIFDAEKIEQFIKNGAHLSDTVARLLLKNEFKKELAEKFVKKYSKKKARKAEEAEKPAKKAPAEKPAKPTGGETPAEPAAKKSNEKEAEKPVPDEESKTAESAKPAGEDSLEKEERKDS